MDVHPSREGELSDMTDATTGLGAGKVTEHDLAKSAPPVAPTGGRERPGGEARGGEARAAAPAKGGREVARLFPHDESDKFELKLQHAVSGFVDGPRGAVEEADRVLEELAARFTEAVTQRRRTLRGAWQATDPAESKGGASSTDTEQLRLALRDYRELAERLLRT
ncbi:hypothetical protein AB5J55_12525 [Streptomyces sp. R11]|uniref:Uncharacterized protein n=1 Tax=Streptomyces sp. R11 TaxID=3238625 RepID=A0AB39MWD9_9ACTN